MRLLILLTIIVLNSTIVTSQNFDSTTMLLKAKVYLLEFLNYNSEAQISEFINTPVPVVFLKSKGFSKHIQFFEIPLSFSKTSNLKAIYDYSFVFAYNAKTEKLYRLKGFQLNEFSLFLDDAKYGGNIDYSSASVEDLQSLKKFMESFYIEGLDMACLYKTAKSTKGKKTRCLWPAQEIYTEGSTRQLPHKFWRRR